MKAWLRTLKFEPPPSKPMMVGVVILNSDLYTNALTVNTAYKRRRLQVDVGIGYEDDIEQAKSVILQGLKQADTVSNWQNRQSLPPLLVIRA